MISLSDWTLNHNFGLRIFATLMIISFKFNNFKYKNPFLYQIIYRIIFSLIVTIFSVNYNINILEIFINIDPLYFLDNF